ncbi:trypsin-like peptidase domain-containing protein [Pendulispora rubella]|uniref:Trypsin-like peptidase domain-containing protein n=1 Tax=Pendulispora rubella TaxID=2741070 RepID=A0ABZ2L3F1_9BACT
MRPLTLRSLVVLACLGLSAPALAQAQKEKVSAQAQGPSPAQVQASQAEARKLSDAFVNVAERVSPSVVQIDVTARDENADQILRWIGRGSSDSPVARGTGSGVVFTPDGAILTNNHVIEGALTINVHLRDGRFLPARLVGRDPATDLAVIKVDTQGLVAAKFADSDAMKVGEWVVAIGSPFGLGYTVTTGVLSAKGRGQLGMNLIEDYLQTDASINPGNSGGPLCDLEGRVVGINTMIVGRGSGIGFAVPSNMARRAAEQILKSGRVERAWIGVGAQDLSPELATVMKVDPRAGALVNAVGDNSPAKRAQIKPGDVIAAVAARPIHDSHDLTREVLSHDVGQTLELEVLRDGKRYGTKVTLAARPEPAVPPIPVQQQGVPQPGLGLTVRDLTPQQASQAGLPSKALPLITGISPGSSADRAGLKVGDVIVEVDGTSEPTSSQVQQAAADGQLLLRVKRRESSFYAALKK